MILRKVKNRGFLGLLAVWMLFLSAVGIHAQDIGQTIEQQFGLYPDFATNMRVEYIGNRLARAAGLPNTTFSVYNEKNLNALALPDGRVYITSKMATLVSDDELAFVIGHELTHVKEKHAQNQQEKVTGGAILGAILVGVLGGDDTSIRMGADIAGGLVYGHYSQKDEYAADKGGIRLMTQIGYDPRKAADAMQRLLDLYGRGDAGTPIIGWFASHPDTKNRKQRLLNSAAELEKSPLVKLPEPVGIDIALDQSAEHAASWAHSYLSILLLENGQGHVATLPSDQYPLPVMPDTPPPPPDPKQKDQKPEEPLTKVTYNYPKAPAGFYVTLSLHPIPAGKAASIDTAEGTAVEAKLHWKQVSTGFSGDCIASAQIRQKTPWQAQQQTVNADSLKKLGDGKSANVEGSLEARALRRASMYFAEILEADAPVDHSAQVTLPMSTSKLRPGDYVYVVRGRLIVAEVCVEQITGKKSAVGQVLWGTHTWKKKDKFVAEEE